MFKLLKKMVLPLVFCGVSICAYANETDYSIIICGVEENGFSWCLVEYPGGELQFCNTRVPCK